MKSPLHILHLEDDPADAELIRSLLEADGISCVVVRVEKEADFLAALDNGDIDLVLSDYSLPTFDGISAVQMVHARRPDLPVIIISGTLGEQQAIDCLQNGATDYILKERLLRLCPAVWRSMQDAEDRAERKKLEALLIEAQKMEVVGHLAGGVAHDFNNILAVIMGYSEVILSKLDAENPLRKYTEEIQHASKRAAGLTRQLLVFSRKQIVNPVVLDLNQVVLEMEVMLGRLVDENIDISMELGKDLGSVSADSGYVGQLLMNLVVNARDAMPQGGKLEIKTDNVDMTRDRVGECGDLAPGGYVMLSIRDTGTGMSAAVKARLFEAFFTTKPAGRGTGLGLSTCQTIVEQSGGHITVASEEGKGTCFKIFFPRVFHQVSEPTRVTPVAGTSPRGTETLLVVEDEPTLRHLVRDVLEGQGYHVLTASNGQDALHVVKANTNSPVKLVVTDVIMPVMGGKVMSEWLMMSDPHLKVLFTSGYTDDTITRHGVLDSRVEFLSKPYTTATLIGKVREMLDEPA